MIFHFQKRNWNAALNFIQPNWIIDGMLMNKIKEIDPLLIIIWLLWLLLGKEKSEKGQCRFLIGWPLCIGNETVFQPGDWQSRDPWRQSAGRLLIDAEHRSSKSSLRRDPQVWTPQFHAPNENSLEIPKSQTAWIMNDPHNSIVFLKNEARIFKSCLWFELFRSKT